GADRAIVVGHDWGSPAAHGAAIKAPARVRLLVSVATPHPASIRITPAMIWRARHFLAFRRRRAPDRLRADDFALVDTLVRRWSPAWNPAPGETEAVKRAFAEPGCVEAAIGYYRAAGNSLPRFLRAPVQVPTVAFAGASDPALPPPAFERARRWHPGGYEVVTLPGGHFLHREHPAEFTAELLRRLPPP
ncbi:MAG TPA: alpha/beta hydrolase, partial [Kofleriaceae bacterium]|nr:alpha/beta hydrolase [Kofleriaceae bacterium]